MTNDEIERNIGFIIERQAQFAANFQKIEEVQARFGSGLREVKDVLLTVVSVVGRLAEAQNQWAEAQIQTNRQLGILAEAQKETHTRLNTFIIVLERHLGGNGRTRRGRGKRSG